MNRPYRQSSRHYLLGVTLLVLSAISCSRSGQYYLEHGNKLFNEGKLSDASLNYRKAIQKNPKFGEAYYRLGLAQLKEGSMTEAYQSLTQAADLMPGNVEVETKLGEVALTAYMLDVNRPKLLYEQATKVADHLL